MKTLYLECNMGAAGDMLAGALLDLLSEQEQNEILNQLNSLGLEGVSVSLESSTKCGISGKHFHVLVNGEEEKSHDVHDYSDHDHHNEAQEHHHVSMESIEDTVRSFPLRDEVKDNVMKVYQLIAEAESHAHQMPVSEIHFHEVGMNDAIMDITAVCLLMHTIHAEQVIISPINTGYGEVRCMHGIVPVPAPAAEYLLRGIPTYSMEKFRGELCTPTGAALLKAFASSFGSRPIMTIEQTGYGMGEKDFEAANCVRAFLGEDQTESRNQKIEKLETNIDDMTGEEIGFAMERLFEAGARDVFITPIFMKKNRPAYLLSVLCLPKDEETILQCIFRYTTTLGVRYQLMDRAVLKRSQEPIFVKDGTIRKKNASGYGIEKSKMEYDDVAEIARKNGKTLWEVKDEAE